MSADPNVRSDGIPVIDISPFRRNEAGARSTVLAVEAACRDTGFFLVTGHGVSAEATDRIYRLARAFFDLPDAYKREQGRGADVQGGVAFAPIAEEALAATLGIKTPGDYKESLNYGPRLLGSAWPDRPENLQAAFIDYFAEMETLARTLRRMFCSAIGPGGRSLRTLLHAATPRPCGSSTIQSRRSTPCPASSAPACIPTTAS